MLGRCYEEGIGVSKNKSISKQWYNKARKNNSSYSLWGEYGENHPLYGIGKNLELELDLYLDR